MDIKVSGDVNSLTDALTLLGPVELVVFTSLTPFEGTP